MQLVDTDSVRAKIDRLSYEKSEIADRIEELNSLEKRLPELESKRQGLLTDLEDERAALPALKDELETLDASAEQTRG